MSIDLPSYDNYSNHNSYGGLDRLSSPGILFRHTTNPLGYEIKIPRVSLTFPMPDERDDMIARAKLWMMLFGSSRMPSFADDAVEKHAGFLDRYLPKDGASLDDDMKQIFKIMKGK